MLKTFSCFLRIMPHDEDKDTVFTGNYLKALLLQSLPPTMQNIYLSKDL